MPLNQRVLDGLVELDDWPRVALYRARWGLPIEPGVPDWYERSGTENHKIEYVASSVLVEGTSKWFNRISDILNMMLKWHHWDEQCSSIYDTYYLASVCVFDHCAKRDGYSEIRNKCRLYFQNTVNLWSAAEDSRGRVILPGKRTSDKGWDKRRDQCLRILRGQDVIYPWSEEFWDNPYNMEANLVRQWGEVENWSFVPESTGHIGLRDSIIIDHVAGGGFIAKTLELTRCYGFPCWVVWSINGKLGSISYKDIPLRSSVAKSMGTGRESLDIDLVPNWRTLIPEVKILSTRVLT